MPKADKKTTYEGKGIALGPLVLPVDEIATAPAESYAKNGVVLWNQRVKATIVIDDTPVEVTASLYVSRDAITQPEADKVADMKKTREDTAKAKKLEAAETLAREKRAAFDMGLEARAKNEKPIAAQVTEAVALLQSLQSLGLVAAPAKAK